MSETIQSGSSSGTATIERDQPVSNLGNTVGHTAMLKEPAIDSTADLVHKLIKRDEAEGKLTMFPPILPKNNLPLRESVNPAADEGSSKVDVPQARGIENSTNNTVNRVGVPSPKKSGFFDFLKRSSLGLSQPGLISNAASDVTPTPPKMDLSAKAEVLRKLSATELTRQENTEHIIPAFADGTLASDEPVVGSTINEKKENATIAATPMPNGENATVPIEEKALQKVTKRSLTESIATAQSKELVLRLFDDYKKNEMLRKGNATFQVPKLDSIPSGSRAGGVKESARVGGLRRLFSRGGRSLLASLVITAGLGQLKPESSSVAPSAISATLHSQDTPVFHDGLGNNLNFPPRSAVTAQAETSVVTIPVGTEHPGNTVNIVNSLQPSQPDSLPLPVIATTPDSPSQSVTQATQSASSETVTDPTELNHKHTVRGEKNNRRGGRMSHYVKRILHRNSPAIEQTPQSPFEQFINGPLNIPAGGSFEGTVQELVASIPEAKNFEGETNDSKADLIAHVVNVLAQAHNPRNADLANIQPGTLPKNIAEYVGEKNVLLLHEVIETTNRTTYATNVLPKIIHIMQGRG